MKTASIPYIGCVRINPVKRSLREAKLHLSAVRKGLSKEAQQKAILAENYYNEGIKSVNEIATDLNISKMTLYKYLRERNVKIKAYRNK